MQMIGRGTRRAAGKEDCVVLDFVDNWANHSVVTIASLFGLPPRFGFQGESVIEVAKQFDTVEELDGGDPLNLDEVRIVAALVPLWDATDPRASWIESAPGVFQVMLGGGARERVVVRSTPNGWYIRPRCERVRGHGELLAHVKRLEANGEIWPPIEFDRFAVSAESARAAVEKAVLRRKSLRDEFVSERQMIALRQSDMADYQQQSIAQHRRFDDAIASKFGQIEASLMRLEARSTQSGERRRRRRFLVRNDGIELYSISGHLRLLAVLKCDEHGCDFFRVVDLPTDENQRLVTLLKGLSRYMKADAREAAAKPILYVVRDHISMKGWDSFLAELSALKSAD
jgi:hypothetical protein